MADHDGYVGVAVSMAPAILIITEQLRQDRAELLALLQNGGTRRFDSQQRLLNSIQSHIRALDVLAGHIDVEGNALNMAKGNIIDNKTVEEANRQLTGVKTETASDVGLAAVGDALAPRAA